MYLREIKYGLYKYMLSLKEYLKVEGYRLDIRSRAAIREEIERVGVVVSVVSRIEHRNPKPPKAVDQYLFTKKNRKELDSLLYIRTFPDARLASIAAGSPRTHIQACCNGKLVSSGGYHWKWASDKNIEGIIYPSRMNKE